ncbi:BolA family transcriptional regulator [Comamonas serinivorans]|uniref:BolA family transcriptional regulator n=2 Tax=Comamonas serinivorans TaxID=1082851 RepID=A0A1Y0ETC0_9BURK|nr:BolA family protein [Comamonas serinivorans]ARU06843.1 BolA family transcriptional regulator [Comamonas serinivorans]
MAQTLRTALPGASVEVIDESWEHAGHSGANEAGLGTHMRVRIQAAQLHGLSRVAQHRLVYDALRPYVEGEGVHALAIEAKALPPA